MTKYISLWVVLTGVIGVVLFNTVSFISRTSFVDIFSEFEIMLILIGFSSVLSTLIVCTTLILDKMKTLGKYKVSDRLINNDDEERVH